MALPSIGAISMADYNTELKNASGTQLSMNSAGFRSITGKTTDSSTVSMTDGYGKTSRATINLTLTGQNYNYILRNNMPGTYVAGKSDITLTIDYNAVLGSTATGSPALTISNFTAGDTIKIINYGYIVGAGGNGGRGANSINGDYVPYPGTSGGTAISCQFATSIDNRGVIGGGGGGGGGGQLYYWLGYYAYYFWGGHGGGGGAGSVPGQGGGGGTGGSPYYGAPGDPGAAGTLSKGGASVPTSGAYQGGNGGDLGNAGGVGLYCYNGVCNVSPYNYGGAGGAGGSCTVGNANITWIATGLRYGGIN